MTKKRSYTLIYYHEGAISELSERKPIPSHVMSELGEISKLYPVSLHSISSQKQLEQYSDISIESDRLRHLCRHLHQEMMGELVWPGKGSLMTHS